MSMTMRDCRRSVLNVAPGLAPTLAPALAVALAGLALPGCIMKQNDTLEVAGVTPSPLRAKPNAIGRDSDAPSVVSLDRDNWGQEDFVVSSDMIAHRPTYARRNTRFDVSARASGRYPTLAEAITLPGGPSESEQIYDAVTWPILIIPAAVLVPIGLVFEPWIPTVGRSPHWEYARRGGGYAGDPAGLTGDPLVDRLGMPVVTEQDAAPMPWAPVPITPAAAAPAAEPVVIPPTGLEPTYVPPPEAVPGTPPAVAPTTAPGGQP